MLFRMTQVYQYPKNIRGHTFPLMQCSHGDVPILGARTAVLHLVLRSREIAVSLEPPFLGGAL